MNTLQNKNISGTTPQSVPKSTGAWTMSLYRFTEWPQQTHELCFGTAFPVDLLALIYLSNEWGDPSKSEDIPQHCHPLSCAWVTSLTDTYSLPVTASYNCLYNLNLHMVLLDSSSLIYNGSNLQNLLKLQGPVTVVSISRLSWGLAFWGEFRSSTIRQTIFKLYLSISPINRDSTLASEVTLHIPKGLQNRQKGNQYYEINLFFFSISTFSNRH